MDQAAKNKTKKNQFTLQVSEKDMITGGAPIHFTSKSTFTNRTRDQ